MAYRKPSFLRAIASPLAFMVISGGFLAGCINDGALTSPEADGIARAGDIPAARVGVTLIYESDVLRAAKAQNRLADGGGLTPQDPEFRAVLDELVDQRLLKLAALDQKIENLPEVKRRLAESRERILAAHLVERRLEDAVSEKNLRDMYQSQTALRQNGNEANVRLIRAVSEAQIKSAAEKLAAGADFGELAADVSTDAASRGNAGALGYVSRAMMPEDLGAAVFSAKVGVASKPFETREGWHIVEVLDFRKPQQASFQAVRDQLRRYKTYTEIQNLMTKVREQGDVEILNSIPPLRRETDPSREPDKE